MNVFEIAEITRTTSALTIFCSNVPTTEWFLKEIVVYFPEIKLVTSNDLKNNKVHIQATNISGDDLKRVWLWLVRELALNGWEPYAISAGTYYLRRKLD